MRNKHLFRGFDFFENVDLKNYSTMKTGGRAKYIVFPRSKRELVKVLKICHGQGMRFYVVGNGSNILFDDSGFDGVLVNLKHFNDIKISSESAFIGAGMNLFYLNLYLQKNNLSGLEWSYGVPATLGGFVVCNGGCFGHEICEFVEEVTVLKDLQILTLKRDEIEFSYRHSSLKDSCVVLEVKLRLRLDNADVIKAKMLSTLEEKRRLQPCDLPSLGSVFKRVIVKEEIVYPAKLIDNMGLKGVKIGGAEVSKKHAGFVVNTGGATSEDVQKLVQFLENKLANLGVFPEREIVVLKNECSKK